MTFINIHTHSINVGELSVVNLDYNDNLQEGIKYSYGLHPWDVGKVDENKVIKYLDYLCANNMIIAVGEIGIDRAISTDINLQKEYFVKQLQIAEKYNLPVIVHAVKANSDLLQIKKQQANSGKWILHAFKGSLQDATQLINKQCLISFGKRIENDKKLQFVLKNIPIEKVFFETDNSDIKIDSVYNFAAQILGINIVELQKQIYLNFKKVFHKKNLYVC